MINILLIDDCNEVLTVCEKMLQRMGYSIIPCHSVAKAMLVLNNKAQKIDLMIADILMPGINGIILAEESKRIRPDMKTLFMSANPLYEDDFDKNIFICKPFRMKEIKDKIDNILA